MFRFASKSIKNWRKKKCVTSRQNVLTPEHFHSCVWVHLNERVNEHRQQQKMWSNGKHEKTLELFGTFEISPNQVPQTLCKHSLWAVSAKHLCCHAVHLHVAFVARGHRLQTHKRNQKHSGWDPTTPLSKKATPRETKSLHSATLSLTARLWTFFWLK